MERLLWNRAMRKAKKEFPLSECEYQPVDHSEKFEELRLATEKMHTALDELERTREEVDALEDEVENLTEEEENDG